MSDLKILHEIFDESGKSRNGNTYLRTVFRIDDLYTKGKYKVLFLAYNSQSDYAEGKGIFNISSTNGEKLATQTLQLTQSEITEFQQKGFSVFPKIAWRSLMDYLRIFFGDYWAVLTEFRNGTDNPYQEIYIKHDPVAEGSETQNISISENHFLDKIKAVNETAEAQTLTITTPSGDLPILTLQPGDVYDDFLRYGEDQCYTNCNISTLSAMTIETMQKIL
jgi:hypothetical protein